MLIRMHAQGVKIYSYRVDSVHSEVYKVLGGLSRTEKPRSEGEDGEHGGTCCVSPATAAATCHRSGHWGMSSMCVQSLAQREPMSCTAAANMYRTAKRHNFAAGA